jgi:glutamate synthase domain-containing protein 2
MGAPFVKMIGMARAPIAATMVGRTIGRNIQANDLPVYVQRFGNSKDEIFVTSGSLRRELGDAEFEKLPTGAIGLYTYYERLAQGLRQIMAGARKFALEHITRDDLCALTKEAAEVSGIPYVMELDAGQVDRILEL